MPPLRDVEHRYTDWKGAEGRCRVRVFPATAAAGGLPVVILSELASNDGPSVTNTVEQLAAEIASRYLPEQDGLEPPFVLVEHYPDRQVHQPARRRGMLQRFGEPDWRRIGRVDVEQLIGQGLGEPACTCAL